MVRAGFEAYVHHRVVRDRPFAEGVQAFHLRVRSPMGVVPALGQQAIARYECGTHQGVGRGIPRPVAGQLQAAVHPMRVVHYQFGTAKMRSPFHADLRAMRVATNTVNAVLDQYQRDLNGLYPLSEVRAIAAAVFQHALGWDLIRVLMDRDAALSESELLRVYMPLKRLRAGEPLQYVLGETTFHGLVIGVDPSVLIPRPETEELVDLIFRSDIRPLRIVDIGTGSGCIALALKQIFPEAQVTGVDVSDQALLRAMDNGRRNALDVTWLRGDILQPDMELPAADLIVSNPPYVPRSEEASLGPHVRAHEPHLALFVEDADPLLFYRAIAGKALKALEQGGALWFEGHQLHSPEVALLLTQLGYRGVQCINDLSGSPRFIRATR